MFPRLLAYIKDTLALGARGAAPACRACTAPVWLAWRFRPTPVMPARLKLCECASRNARAMRPACCLFALRTAPQFRPRVGEIARRWTHLSLCCASLARWAGESPEFRLRPEKGGGRDGSRTDRKCIDNARHRARVGPETARPEVAPRTEFLTVDCWPGFA